MPLSRPWTRASSTPVRAEPPLSADRPARARLLRDLRALIARSTSGLTGSLDPDAPLITSGALESTALIGVALWVERRIGREMDLGAFDLVTEWDSLNAIVNFVERHAVADGDAGHRV